MDLSCGGGGLSLVCQSRGRDPLADRGVGMVISTPYMDEAERCHRVGLMHKGRLLTVGRPRDIIENHTETVVQIAGVDARRAQETLGDLECALDVYPFGASVHVAVPNRDALPEVEKALRDEGLSWTSFECVRPSFEDVFLAMLRKES